MHELDADDTKEQKDITDSITVIIRRVHEIHAQILPSYLANPSELQKAVKAFGSGKSPSSGNITYMALKNMSKISFCQLTCVVNAMFRLQHYPSKWKIAVVVPMSKPGNDPASLKSPSVC